MTYYNGSWVNTAWLKKMEHKERSHSNRQWNRDWEKLSRKLDKK